MRSHLRVIPCLLFVIAACGFSQIKDGNDTGKWINLVADSALREWSRVPVPPTAPLAAVSPWRADPTSGTLICDGDKAGHEWFRYNREFSNFVFHVEWRFNKLEGDRKYNSGIYVRNSSDGTIWHQAQLGSSSGGYIFGDTLVGGVRQRVNLSRQVKEQRVKEAGDWNVFEIQAEGRNLALWVNGAITSEFRECEVSRGYVGLEAEGYSIEFRNIRLKELR
ncbi:MAG TPA: DUF1080 domain-containing protein [Acidobacteriota bacterium]|nr:DUF1080 domain-containing protein [Acidobacteriota bacterium]